MTYLAPADFRERTVKPYCKQLELAEGEASDAQLTTLIAQVASRVEIDLHDRFDPPDPDADETYDLDGSGLQKLHLPWRVRSITSVSTRDDAGTLTAQAAGAYRLRQSLNAAGTAMLHGRRLDWLIGLTLSTGVWPLGTNTVRIVGKVGWAAVPDDVKRLVALGVYDLVKPLDDPLNRVTARSSLDATFTYGAPREAVEIASRYVRAQVMVA